MQTQTFPANIPLSALAAPFVRMKDEEAASLARELFHLSGVLERLATEKDDTFRVTERDGARYIVKVANPAESADEIDLQTSLLRYIATRAPALPTPRVLDSRQGAYATIVDQSGQQRHIRTFTYLPGTLLDTCSATAAQREEVGEALAGLRLAMAQFAHPAATRDLAWDVKNLPRLSYLIEGITDKHQRRQLDTGFDRFAQLTSRIGRLPTQVLHNDFSKSNIVVRQQAGPFVAGIIDFGDTVKTAIAIDVSTALLNQLPRNEGTLPDEDMFREAKDVLRGYLRIASLSDDELALVPHLVMGRVITRALLSLNLASRFPENRDYLLRNTLQGWAQLDWFLRRSPDEVSQTLMSIN